MDHELACAEIVTQARALRDVVGDADPRAPVPSCPGWTVGHLVRHVCGAHRWVHEVVATRATTPVPDDDVNEVPSERDDDLAILGAELVDGAEALAAVLREAGPDTHVWSPSPDPTVRFWARRMLHETLLHRADATLALGRAFTVDPAVAADALDEWLEQSVAPEAYATDAGQTALLGAGRTVGLHADDVDAHWSIDLTGAVPSWSHAPGPAAVELRGPASELALFVYRRPAPAVTVAGATALLDLWLARANFWLEA